MIDFFAQLPTRLAKLAALVVVLASVVILIKQLNDDAYRIRPIHVPSSLVSSGYTPEVTARWIVDEMLEIKRQATSVKKDKLSIAPDAEKFDMVVPGSKLTLNTIGQALRESLGFPEKTISGEIVSVGEGFQLHLRLSGDSSYSQKNLTDQDIDALTNAAAESAVQLTAPFTYAAYLYAKGRTEELDQAIEYCLNHGPKDDRAWALNLRGIMFDDQENSTRAIENYGKALDENPEFAIAHLNWANTLYKQGQHEVALKKFRHAVSLDGGLRDPSKEAGYLLTWSKVLMAKPNPNFQGAIKKFEEIERIILDGAKQSMSDELPAVYSKWGEALEGLGDNDAAVAMYEKAINVSPEDYEFLQHDINRINNEHTAH